MRLFRTKEDRATGVHLCGRSVRMAETCRRKGVLYLKGLGYGELPSETDIESLLNVGAREEIAGVIKSTAKTHKVDTQRAIVSISNSFPVLKQTPLMEGSEEERREQILWEAEQFLISSPEEYAIDFSPVGGNAFIVAVRRAAIDICVEICDRAGIGLTAVDVDPLALFNAGEILGAFAPSELGIIASVEFGSVSFAVTYKGSLVSAEMMIFRNPDEDGEKIGVSVARRVKRIARRCRQLEGEGSFEPYRTVLSGTGAEVPEIVEALRSRLETPLEIADPFRNLELGLLPAQDLSLIDRKEIFTVSVGLACRGLEERD